jgi:hypothetical protein
MDDLRRGTARRGGVLGQGRTAMSDRVPPPELKARWRREAMAAIGRRLRLFYVAEPGGRCRIVYSSS